LQELLAEVVEKDLRNEMAQCWSEYQSRRYIYGHSVQQEQRPPPPFTACNLNMWCVNRFILRERCLAQVSQTLPTAVICSEFLSAQLCCS
jgi:hypothetical protein